MTRAAIYARVSTEDQDLEGQVRELQEYVKQWVPGPASVSVYREKVSARGKAKRLEYDRLVSDAKAGEIQEVFVWALDRFSREETFTKATQTILDLEKAGVRFHSLKEPMLDTPEDGKPNLGRDVLLALLPVIAAFESRRRSERVRVAMQEIKEGRRRTKSGRPPGRQPKITQDHAEAIVRLRESGLPYSAIAQRVRLPIGTCRKVVSLSRRGLRAFRIARAPNGPTTGGGEP